MDDDASARGVPRGSDGSVLLSVTGLPDSVVSEDDLLLDVRDEFAGKPSAALTETDSGQAWVVHHTGNANATPRVVSGRLATTMAPGDSSGNAYPNVNVGSDVTHLIGDFRFDGTIGSARSSFALLALEAPLVPGPIPEMACHHLWDHLQWAFGIWDNSFSTRTVTVTTVSGSPIVNGPAGTFEPNDAGRPLAGTGILNGSKIQYISDTQARLSGSATASGTVAATVRGFTLSDLINGMFVSPLKTGVDYTMEVVLDYDSSTAYLTFPVPVALNPSYLQNAQAIVSPDGRVVSITDPRIAARRGPWACFELLPQDPAQAAIPSYTGVWAGGSDRVGPGRLSVSALDVARAALHAVPVSGDDPRPVVVAYYPASDTNIDMFVTGSVWKTLDGSNLKVTFTAPKSGKVVISLSGYLTSFATNPVYWGVSTSASEPGASAPYAETLVRESAVKGQARTEHLIAGLTPGASYTYFWRGRTLATGENAHLLQVGAGSARRAFMVATPVAA